MAVTRATSKAYRIGYAWLMLLAGLEATPAEEIPQETASTEQIEQPRPALRPSKRPVRIGTGSWGASEGIVVVVGGTVGRYFYATRETNPEATEPDKASERKDVCDGGIGSMPRNFMTRTMITTWTTQPTRHTAIALPVPW